MVTPKKNCLDGYRFRDNRDADSCDAASDNTGQGICQQETEISSHGETNASAETINTWKSKGNISTANYDLLWLEVKTENPIHVYTL